MSFDDLPPLPRMIHPEANDYAARCMAASREVQSRWRTIVDCRYGDDYWQRYDVYLPQQVGKAAHELRGLPVLIFFHGGAWTSGTKEWMGFMAPPLLSLPAIFVSANYRLAPTVRYPSMLDDCLAAIASVHQRIAEFGGDPGRLFVGGHSAGGHLASLATLDEARRTAAGLPADAIRGCLAVSASFELRNRSAAAGTLERRIYDMVLAREDDDLAASPLAHVAARSAPFFIAWGERDFPRLVTQARAMVGALTDAGVEVEAMQLDGVDHFGASEACGDPAFPWIHSARKWLAHDLRRPS